MSAGQPSSAGGAQMIDGDALMGAQAARAGPTDFRCANNATTCKLVRCFRCIRMACLRNPIRDALLSRSPSVICGTKSEHANESEQASEGGSERERKRE